jgi:hypothetical protein
VVDDAKIDGMIYPCNNYQEDPIGVERFDHETE